MSPHRLPTPRRAPLTLCTALGALACAALLALLAPAAHAACWAADVAEPATPDGVPQGHPSLAPLRALLDTLAHTARANPGLAALPEVRLRIRRDILDSDAPSQRPREAVLHAQGFGPKAWGRGECELIPQHERLGPKAGISFFVNSPLARLNRWIEDEQLTAYLEPERGEPIQGWPVYGGCAVLTPDRTLWWTAVTVAEWLDYSAREQQRRIDDFDRRNRRQVEDDGAATMARLATLKALDERAHAQALAVVRENEARRPAFLAQLREARAMLVAELDDLRRTRATLAPGALAEPFRLGSGRHRLPTPGEAGRPLRRIVKLRADYPWDARDRTRVQTLQVCPSLLDRHPQFGPPMRQAVDGLDLARLAALLR